MLSCNQYSNHISGKDEYWVLYHQNGIKDTQPQPNNNHDNKANTQSRSGGR